MRRERSRRAADDEWARSPRRLREGPFGISVRSAEPETFTYQRAYGAVLELEVLGFKIIKKGSVSLCERVSDDDFRIVSNGYAYRIRTAQPAEPAQPRYSFIIVEGQD